MFTACILALAASIRLTEAFPSKAPKQRFDWDSTRHLIAFGDSYTYVQGTHGHTNYSFIGDQLNFEYDARTLLTNKIAQNQTSTASGGPNWVEFLTDCGVKEGLTSPITCRKQRWDFAFAGTDISVEHLPLHHNFTVSLVNQIAQFKEYGHPVLTTKDKHKHKHEPIVDPTKTLIAIWIGINDINDSASLALPSYQSFYNTLTTTLFNSVQILHSLGYTSYLFLNLPPLNRNPANQKRAMDAQTPNATQVQWFNDALAQHAAEFQENNPDTNVPCLRRAVRPQ